MRVKRKSSFVAALALGLIGAGCSSSSTPYGGDAGGAKTIVINELFPSGPDAANPDWIELKNLGAAATDVGGYQLRDSAIADLTSLPAGTMIDAGGYLIIYCDDRADGGVAGGVHVPWKLSSGKGDEVHLLDKNGAELDVAAFPAGIPAGKTWGRLPDGTGAFVRTTPTQGQANL